MTKEEITICKMYLEDLDNTHTCNEYKLLMELLEQPTSDDCVSRAEMLKYQQYLHGKMSNEENHKLWEFIKDLPPVTPTFPKGATNGDIIKAMFPSVEVKEKNNGYEVYFGIGTSAQYFNHQWWNALYKRGNENGSN